MLYIYLVGFRETSLSLREVCVSFNLTFMLVGFLLFSYGLMYKVKNKKLVCFGKLSKKLCASFGIKEDVYAADFDWDLLLEITGHY